MTTAQDAWAPTDPAQEPGGRPAKALIALGSCSVVSGGVLAAVTEPLQLAKGSWLAAYLVLVGGVAQYAMGQARARPAQRPDRHGSGWAQVGSWNLGNAAVIAGTLAGIPLLVDVGALMLVIGLGIALRSLRHRPSSTAGRDRLARSADWAYAGLLLLLLFSIPVGVILAHTRTGT